VGDGEVQRVSAGWTRANLWALGAIGIGVAYALARAFVNHDTLSGTLVGVLIGVTLASGAWFGGTFFVLTRRVDLSREAVAFVVGLARTRVAWSDLVPPRSPFFITLTFKYRVGGKVKEDDPMGVSKRQARAILTHPSCPKFRMERAIWESVGLSPP
jgi:hypothetical protein